MRVLHDSARSDILINDKIEYSQVLKQGKYSTVLEA
jgi:hypothetical protein